jgi:hypothetical protein
MRSCYVVQGVFKLMDSSDAHKMVNFIVSALYVHEAAIKTLFVCVCVRVCVYLCVG